MADTRHVCERGFVSTGFQACNRPRISSASEKMEKSQGKRAREDAKVGTLKMHIHNVFIILFIIVDYQTKCGNNSAWLSERCRSSWSPASEPDADFNVFPSFLFALCSCPLPLRSENLFFFDHRLATADHDHDRERERETERCEILSWCPEFYKAIAA